MELVKVAIFSKPVSLEFASDKLKNNEEFQNLAIKLSGEKKYASLQFFSIQLRNKKEFVLNFVGVFGENLEFASDELRNDMDVINAAMRNTVKSVLYVHPDYSNLKELWINIEDNEYNLLNNLPDELIIDRDSIKKILNKNPKHFGVFAFYYYDDDEICEQVYRMEPEAYIHFSERLKGKYIPVIENTFSQNDDLPF